MKPLTRIALACALALPLGGTAFAAQVASAATTAATSSADRAFMHLADQYFDDYYFPTNPSTATTDGLHAWDDKLEDYSRAGVDANIKALQQWEARVAATDPKTLGAYVQGDRELLLNNIRSTLLTLQAIRPWQKNPDNYSSGITSSAFTLMERKFASPETRLRALIAREQQMPAALADARKNLDNPPQIYTQIALEQLPGLVSFFEHDVPSAFADVTDAGLKKQFAASNGAVIKALQDYQAWLKSDLLPRSHGDFRIGAQAYRDKLKYDEMVTLPLAQLIAIDTANMRANQQQFAKVAHELDPGKTPQQVLAELAADHPAPDKLLDTFRGSFGQLIAFIRQQHIITLPSDVRPIVEETPPFMRATTFASMDTPGPYETVAKEAYFNVTLPDPSWSKEHTQEFMAQFSYPVINSVATHEAYPGHYIQFLWMHRLDDRVRKLLGANTNVEGWAHYCEQMMLDEGLAQFLYPHDRRQQLLLRLGQLQDALLRNARFIVGIKLHTGQMSMAQAVDFFVKEGYQSRAVGEVETKRGTSDPTYLYYTLGKLEILKLRADLQKKQGKDFNLERFHDAFMQQGFAPIAIVRKAMLETIHRYFDAARRRTTAKDDLGMRRLIALFDGTWEKPESNTNVERLRRLIAPCDAAGVEQRVEYVPGVGVVPGLAHLLGGAFGYGLSGNVKDGYRWLCRHWQPGDEIWLFGFSRGAYSARSLAGLVRKCGLLRRDGDGPVDEDAIAAAYAFYRDTAIRPGDADAIAWRAARSVETDIHFIGAWETVGELGIPHTAAWFPFARARYELHDTELSRIVKHAYQALALDEHRGDLAPTKWTRNPDRLAPGESPTAKKAGQIDVEQRWFVGAHGDVGGGYRHDGAGRVPDPLPGLALAWLQRKAMAAGLACEELFLPLPDADLGMPRNAYGEFMFGIYKLFRPPYNRVIGGGVNETVDESVWRHATLTDYRSPTLEQALREDVVPAPPGVA